GSAANMAIIPLQDLLRLGIEARMNTPGTTGNNWEWRYSRNQEMERRGKEILKLTTQCERYRVIGYSTKIIYLACQTCLIPLESLEDVQHEDTLLLVFLAIHACLMVLYHIKL
ncbi:MAG: 4-alpha-glucanotransferase, partial [Candidatus Heimdallarchaeota archaeon]|nr:4-alpha-glucanotransferase [Candidatus Heimdallarchaeota archaeon]